MTNTRRLKRGGAKFTVQPKTNKNKTARAAKPFKQNISKPKSQHKSFLKTLKKSIKPSEVTPDKYAKGVIKFLNKILDADTDDKSYNLYIAASSNIFHTVKDAMQAVNVEIKDYELYELVEDLRDTLVDLVDAYQNADATNKINAEIQLYTLLNLIMNSIKKTREGFKKKNKANELADLFGGLTMKKMNQPKKNINISDLAALFSKTGQ